MKVLDLHCDHGHGFEGWFDSEDDFQSQLAGGLLSCPVCGSAQLTKRPSAPRLNLSGAQAPQAQAPVPAAEPAVAPNQAAHAYAQQLQAAWLQAVRQVMQNTEDVGERFAEEARRIHYGESPERGIRGQTSREEAVALREEGIDVYSLPVPAALKGPVQ